MSGHSKWKQIKQKKGITDRERGKIFSKIIREITVAAREGGDIELNPKLRKVVEKAKAVNMPYENIKRAIQRGTGELEGTTYEYVTYEGYGPAGVAIYIEALTDNKKRTAAEIRSIFSKYNGSLGEAGCVSWLFHKSGLISIDKSKISEEEIFSIGLEVGAKDIKVEENTFDIITSVEDFENVKLKLKEKGIEIVSSEITMIPSTYIKLDGKEAEHCLNLINALEDHDDVENVYSNFDIPEKILEKVA